MALLKPNSIINDDLILQGPIIDGNGSKGSNGQYLTSNGTSSAPTWQDYPTSGGGGSNETTECYKVNLLQTSLGTSTTPSQLTSWLNTTTDNQVSFTLGSGSVTTNHIQVATNGRYLVGYNLDINFSGTTATLRTVYGFEITVNGTVIGTSLYSRKREESFTRKQEKELVEKETELHRKLVEDLTFDWATRMSEYLSGITSPGVISSQGVEIVPEGLKYSKDYYRKKGTGRPTKKDRRDIDDYYDASS